MALPDPQPGLIIRYNFLWHSEHGRGRDEGHNDRPWAVVLRTVADDGETIVAVLPITHSEPRDPGEAVELPLKVKRFLGLDSQRSWVILTEINRFVWPGPDLRPMDRVGECRIDYGHLPTGLFRTIRDKFLEYARQRRLRVVWRTE